MLSMKMKIKLKQISGVFHLKFITGFLSFLYLLLLLLPIIIIVIFNYLFERIKPLINSKHYSQLKNFACPGVFSQERSIV